jgi:GDP-D-mannose dehydratase
MLEAIRLVDPTVRFYQASSSEILGEPYESSAGTKTPRCAR